MVLMALSNIDINYHNSKKSNPKSSLFSHMGIFSFKIFIFVLLHHKYKKYLQIRCTKNRVMRTLPTVSIKQNCLMQAIKDLYLLETPESANPRSPQLQPEAKWNSSTTPNSNTRSSDPSTRSLEIWSTIISLQSPNNPTFSKCQTSTRLSTCRVTQTVPVFAS